MNGDGLSGGIVLALSGEHTLLLSVTSSSVVSVVGHVGSGVLLSVVVGDGSSRVGELARLELEGREVELGDGPKVIEDEDGLSEDIEDTVEDHLGIGVDDSTTVRKSPSDRVEEPEEGEDGGGGGEGLLVCGTESTGGDSGRAEEDPENVEEGKVTCSVSAGNDIQEDH